jgi:hypothetical protein
MMCALGACGRLGVELLPPTESGLTPADTGLLGRDGSTAAADAGADSMYGGVDSGSDASSSEGTVDASVDSGMDAGVEPACATPCANSHGSADCSAGQCQISCAIGFADCDGKPDNGCETATSSELMSCGACNLACTTAFGATQCSEGICTPSCMPGKSGDCDNLAQNGCETNLMTDPAACGSCGTSCTNAHGSTNCVSGACTPVCATDYADCDGNPVNGCETDIATDAANCGGCGMTCDTAFQVCAKKQCQVSMCPQGSGDCDTNQADCETNLTNSISDCGFCNNTCTVANGTPRCTSGACAIASCNAGHADCDAAAANGCEVTLATNLANCGSCGAACTNAHGSTSCSSSACAPTCSSGWGSCDGNARNGCETALNTLTNCGSCGNVCPNSMAGASAVCNSGVCGYTCNALGGVYGLRINATTNWPGQQYVQSGSGPIQFWLRLTLTQSGTALSGSAELCDQATPDFRNSVTSDRYLADYPSALFTPGAPAAAFSATLASLSPGAGLSSSRAAHVLGVSLADPLNGAWPSLSGVLSSQVDHDKDGKVGITVTFIDDSTYNHPQTAGTLTAARASSVYGAQRLRFSIAGALTGCNGASGAATVQSFDTETIGCRLESGSDCSTTQYTHLHDNAIVNTVSNASYLLTKLAATGSSVTCAQVRSAL